MYTLRCIVQRGLSLTDGGAAPLLKFLLLHNQPSTLGFFPRSSSAIAVRRDLCSAARPEAHIGSGSCSPQAWMMTFPTAVYYTPLGVWYSHRKSGAAPLPKLYHSLPVENTHLTKYREPFGHFYVCPFPKSLRSKGGCYSTNPILFGGQTLSMTLPTICSSETQPTAVFRLSELVAR